MLLHGARFTTETWRELGTIDLLAEAGFHVVALDLPGFGRSQSVEIDRHELLAKVLDALAIDSAVVVSPSMSGQFSFPLVTRSTERVAGFVPIAPSGIDDYVRTLRKVSVPTLIFWGERLGNCNRGGGGGQSGEPARGGRLGEVGFAKTDLEVGGTRKTK